MMMKNNKIVKNLNIKKKSISGGKETDTGCEEAEIKKMYTRLYFKMEEISKEWNHLKSFSMDTVINDIKFMLSIDNERDAQDYPEFIRNKNNRVYMRNSVNEKTFRQLEEIRVSWKPVIISLRKMQLAFLNSFQRFDETVLREFLKTNGFITKYSLYEDLSVLFDFLINNGLIFSPVYYCIREKAIQLSKDLKNDEAETEPFHEQGN